MMKFALMIGLVAMGYVNHIHAEPQLKPPVKVIFDTDISGDWDDVGATAALLALADLGETEILAMGVSAAGFATKWSPLCLDAINTYYGRPDIPIGVIKRDIGDTWSPYAKVIAENWPHDLKEDEVWEAVALYRKTLSEQPDTSVVMISVGYLGNMADLLKSKPDRYSDFGGLDLVNKKVKKWVCMGGRFPSGWESNLASLAKDTKYAVDNWPRPILFSGIQIGSAIRSGQGLVRTGFDNPIRAAYEISCGQVGCDHANWDQTAVLAAIRDPLKYWDVVTTGYCAIEGKEAKSVWKLSPDKEHSYLVNKGNAEEISEIIDALMTKAPYPFSDKEALVVNLKFDENAGDFAPDASGNNHNGVFLGQHSWVEGKFGTAACFDEDSKWMHIDNSADFNPYPKKFSFALWIKYPGQVPNKKRVLLKSRVDRGFWMSIYKDEANKVSLQIKETSISSKTTLTSDTWHHVAVAFDSDTASFYFDGRLEDRSHFFVSDLWMLSRAGYRIGANVDGKEMTTTCIDDFFFLNRAITEDELIEIMNERK